MAVCVGSSAPAAAKQEKKTATTKADKPKKG